MKPSVSLILIAFDNLTQCNQRTQQFVEACDLYGYQWDGVIVQNGSSTIYPKHINRIIDAKPGEKFASHAIYRGSQVVNGSVTVYMCSHHGTSRNHEWLPALVESAHSSGSLCGSLHPIGCGPAALQCPEYPDDNPMFRMHIQGGIWAAPTKRVRACIPHPKYVHGYEDVIRSWQFLDRGWGLKNVPGIYSTGIRGRVCENPQEYSYIHDYH